VVKKKAVKMSLEQALKKAGPEMEYAVKRALKRAVFVGIFLGAFAGFVLAALVIAWHTSPRLVQNAQPCDLFAFGPVRPSLPSSVPQVCWTEVGLPDVNWHSPTVFVCPTPYALNVQMVVGDVNGDTVRFMYDECLRLRESLARRYGVSDNGTGAPAASNGSNSTGSDTNSTDSRDAVSTGNSDASPDGPAGASPSTVAGVCAAEGTCGGGS